MTDRHRRRFLHPRPACSLPAIARAWARSSRTPTLGQLQQRPEMFGRRLGGTAMQAGAAWVPDGLAGLDQPLRAIEQRPEIRIAARQKVVMPTVQVTLCNKAWQATASHVPSGADAGQHGLSRSSLPPPPRARRKGLGGMRAGRTVWCAKVGRHADASARRIAVWMTGVSWHLAGNLEWVPDCTQVRFDGAAAVGTGREKEKTLFSRLQVSCRAWRKR